MTLERYGGVDQTLLYCCLTMSFWAGIWLWILALIFIYIVSLALTSGVLDYLYFGHNSDQDFQILQTHFGDIPTTVYTLLASITHGDTWTLCSDALWRSKPHLAAIFFMLGRGVYFVSGPIVFFHDLFPLFSQFPVMF